MKTHLVFAVMTVALLALVISQSDRKTLSFDQIIAQAESLSRQPFEPRKPIPDVLRQLNYDQLRDIRYREDQTLWRREGLPFQARFFYGAGEHNSAPVTVFRVNGETAGQVRFSPDQFTFGPLVKLSPEDQARGDYSGFRLYYLLNKPNQLDEVLVFQGASYFRPLARGQQYGLSARGIAIDTPGREDFPSFTTFWLVRPTSNASEMTLYALLEGRDLTGAYEFRLAPGAETRIHVRAVLFPRDVRKPGQKAPPKVVKDIGYAPLTSMYWYGENTSNTFGNWRPEVHDSDGLQIHRGNGEWVWHPLAWARQRQINVFADKNPKGFGLFQRDRDFTHYQDLEAHYHQRPSAWVQPDGDWGAGAVVLMQNPTRDEFADNIVAYWQPEGGVRAGQRIDLAYTLTTFTDRPDLPPLARCVSTRIDYQNEEYFRLVVLDFAGGELENLPAEQKPQLDIWSGKGGEISRPDITRIPNTNLWRVSFTVSTKQSSQPIDLGCVLRRDGRPLTETWSYPWVK